MQPLHPLHARAARHRLLGDPTRLAIVEALADRPHPIAELVARTGVHRNTVRAHLARLEAAGIVERAWRPPAGRGRPAAQYRLRQALAMDGAEQSILIGSLVRLVARGFEAGASEEASEEGYLVGRQLGAVVGPGSARQAMRQLIDILHALAFEPRAGGRGGIRRITLANCPFAVSPDDPRGSIICSFHLGLIRGVVAVAGPPGRHRVQLLPHVAPGECRTELQFARQA